MMRATKQRVESESGSGFFTAADIRKQPSENRGVDERAVGSLTREWQAGVRGITNKRKISTCETRERW